MLVAEKDMITGLTSHELAETELQMLEVIAPVAEAHRVEFAAYLTLRQSVHGPLNIGIDNESRNYHQVLFDVFSEDQVGIFRYDMRNAFANPQFSASNELLRRHDTPLRAIDKILQTDGGNEPVIITKTSENPDGDPVNIDRVDDVTPQHILDLLTETIDVVDDSVWPRTRDDENPVLGINYGAQKPLIDPHEIRPLYAQLVQVGTRALRASGVDTAADLTLSFDVGRGVNRASRQDAPATVSLWSQSHEARATLDCAVTTLSDVAFLEVVSKTDEYNVDGRVKRTIHNVWQQGDHIEIRSTVKHKGVVTVVQRESDLSGVVDLARLVEKVAQKEEIPHIDQQVA